MDVDVAEEEQQQQPSSLENKHRFYRPPERPSFVSCSWSPFLVCRHSTMMTIDEREKGQLGGDGRIISFGMD